jgi:hypothetical protein
MQDARSLLSKKLSGDLADLKTQGLRVGFWLFRGEVPRYEMMISRGRVTAAAISGRRQKAASRNSVSYRGLIPGSAVAAWPPPGRSGEGHVRIGRDRSNHWRIAYTSAKEVDSHLKLLTYAGAINRTAADDAMIAFDEVRAMTWRLLNPRS